MVGLMLKPCADKPLDVITGRVPQAAFDVDEEGACDFVKPDAGVFVRHACFAQLPPIAGSGVVVTGR